MNSYEVAVDCLLSGNTDGCFDFFKEHADYLELAYCYLLQDKIYDAKIFFGMVDNPRGLWGKRLTKVLLDEFDEAPSYFEVRNFFEIDLNLFIKTGKYDYANAMLKYIDWFYVINSESYKLIARVLLNNDYIEPAKVYIEKSKSKFYNDPELHYIDMQFYERTGDYDSALKAVENCLNIIPTYYPALQSKERLLKLKKV